MDEHAPEGQETTFVFQVPPELEGGVYSNFLGVWHTPHEFTLDFAVMLPAQAAEQDQPEGAVTAPCRVVARVKIPPTMIFDVLRTINDNMTRYEATFGPIRRPDADAPDAA